jgi:hypothetical protein
MTHNNDLLQSLPFTIPYKPPTTGIYVLTCSFQCFFELCKYYVNGCRESLLKTSTRVRKNLCSNSGIDVLG